MPATKLAAAIGPPNAATSRGAGRVDVMAAPSSEAGTRPPRTGGRTGPANVDPPPPAPSCERQHGRNRLRARRRVEGGRPGGKPPAVQAPGHAWEIHAGEALAHRTA